MRLGSLFAGVGGFDLAAERAGMTVAWQSENDKNAAQVLAHHWPEVPNHGDIHRIHLEAGDSTPRQRPTVEGAGVPAGRGRRSDVGYATDGVSSEGEADAYAAGVDVLCGGFPCQDYSAAGTRGGLAGDRGALWWEFHRLITEGRPRWVVGENVPGILSSRAGADFATIIDSLTELGYSVGWRVLDAQYFGVAQRRRRVFIVGHLGDRSVTQVLALSEGLSRHPPPSRTSGKDVAPTISARTNGGGGLGTDTELDGGLIPSLSYALTARAAMDRPESGAATLIPLGGFRWQENRQEVSLADPITALTAEQTQAVAFAQNQRDEIRDLGDISGALAAEPGMKQQTYIANHQVRRLTPLECERLQGFPDNWTATQSDTQRYRQMGNAVAVPVAEWLMRRIMEEDR